MNAAVLAQVQHMTVQPLATHPSLTARRYRRSVASMLGMSPVEVDVAARALAERQAARGVRTIDTAALGGA